MHAWSSVLLILTLFLQSIALDQGILKCISTDTVRAVMRSFIASDISPALHRSSYSVARRDSGADDDPIVSWLETCTVLGKSVSVFTIEKKNL